MEVPITVAKRHLSALVDAVQRGERVIITKRGEPVAELIAYTGRGRDVEERRQGGQPRPVANRRTPPDA